VVSQFEIWGATFGHALTQALRCSSQVAHAPTLRHSAAVRRHRRCFEVHVALQSCAFLAILSMSGSVPRGSVVARTEPDRKIVATARKGVRMWFAPQCGSLSQSGENPYAWRKITMTAPGGNGVDQGGICGERRGHLPSCNIVRSKRSSQLILSSNLQVRPLGQISAELFPLQ